MAEQVLIEVEVAYALPEKQALVKVSIPEGSSALDAARASNIEAQFPGLVLDEGSRMGIFGQVVSASQTLQAGDRVELYRPLIADPKEVRKARAARAKARRESDDDGGAS